MIKYSTDLLLEELNEEEKNIFAFIITHSDTTKTFSFAIEDIEMSFEQINSSYNKDAERIIRENNDIFETDEFDVFENLAFHGETNTIHLLGDLVDEDTFDKFYYFAHFIDYMYNVRHQDIRINNLSYPVFIMNFILKFFVSYKETTVHSKKEDFRTYTETALSHFTENLLREDLNEGALIGSDGKPKNYDSIIQEPNPLLQCLFLYKNISIIQDTTSEEYDSENLKLMLCMRSPKSTVSKIKKDLDVLLKGLPLLYSIQYEFFKQAAEYYSADQCYKENMLQNVEYQLNPLKLSPKQLIDELTDEKKFLLWLTLANEEFTKEAYAKGFSTGSLMTKVTKNFRKKMNEKNMEDMEQEICDFLDVISDDENLSYDILTFMRTQSLDFYETNHTREQSRSFSAFVLFLELVSPKTIEVQNHSIPSEEVFFSFALEPYALYRGKNKSKPSTDFNSLSPELIEEKARDIYRDTIGSKPTIITKYIGDVIDKETPLFSYFYLYFSIGTMQGIFEEKMKKPEEIQNLALSLVKSISSSDSVLSTTLLKVQEKALQNERLVVMKMMIYVFEPILEELQALAISSNDEFDISVLNEAQRNGMFEMLKFQNDSLNEEKALLVKKIDEQKEKIQLYEFNIATDSYKSKKAIEDLKASNNKLSKLIEKQKNQINSNKIKMKELTSELKITHKEYSQKEEYLSTQLDREKERLSIEKKEIEFQLNVALKDVKRLEQTNTQSIKEQEKMYAQLSNDYNKIVKEKSVLEIQLTEYKNVINERMTPSLETVSFEDWQAIGKLYKEKNPEQFESFIKDTIKVDNSSVDSSFEEKAVKEPKYYIGYYTIEDGKHFVNLANGQKYEIFNLSPSTFLSQKQFISVRSDFSYASFYAYSFSEENFQKGFGFQFVAVKHIKKQGNTDHFYAYRNTGEYEEILGCTRTTRLLENQIVLVTSDFHKKQYYLRKFFTLSDMLPSIESKGFSAYVVESLIDTGVVVKNIRTGMSEYKPIIFNKLEATIYSTLILNSEEQLEKIIYNPLTYKKSDFYDKTSSVVISKIVDGEYYFTNTHGESILLKGVPFNMFFNIDDHIIVDEDNSFLNKIKKDRSIETVEQRKIIHKALQPTEEKVKEEFVPIRAKAMVFGSPKMQLAYENAFKKVGIAATTIDGYKNISVDSKEFKESDVIVVITSFISHENMFKIKFSRHPKIIYAQKDGTSFVLNKISEVLKL